MTQPQYNPPPSFPSAPPAPGAQQPDRKPPSDSGGVKAAKFAGMLVMIAIASVVGALFLVWAIGLLHEWWPSIPLITFGLSLKLSLLLGAWRAFNELGKQFMPYLRVKYGTTSTDR